MTQSFTVELRGQEEWSWLVAIDLFLGGLGGGLFLLFKIFKLPLIMGIVSLALVVLGALVLFAELGRPARAWRVIARPLTSWISRGVIAVSLFIAAGALSVAPQLNAFAFLPWGQGTMAGTILGSVAAIAAFFVALYPGFVLSASPSIPSWNSPLLPVLFLFSSLLGATGIALLLSSPLGISDGALQPIFYLAALLIAVNLGLVVTHLMTLNRSVEAARESARRLNQGALGWTFKLGVILVGMLLPLSIIAWLPSGAIVAGALILIGGLLFRYCILKAGVYVQFPLA
jgi:formate-dependent nitrite reductase membrane component NrfD